MSNAMNQAESLNLRQISKLALKMKRDEREIYLSKIFSSSKFYGKIQSQKIGSKKFNRGQIIQVEMDSGTEERIILGFKSFARSTQLSFEDVDEHCIPTFILGSESGDVRYWRASQVLSVEPYWQEALLMLQEEALLMESSLLELKKIWDSNAEVN